MCALVTAPAFAISAAVKSQQDYVLTLSALRNLKVIIENFGTSEQQTRFSELKLKFKEACERHYAQQFFRPTTMTETTAPDNNFQASVELFHEVKLQFVALLAEFSTAYIKRSTDLLDFTSKEAHDILMNYHKESRRSDTSTGRSIR
jgi:hypothetical protein